MYHVSLYYLPSLEITWSKLCELNNPLFFLNNLINKYKKWDGFPTPRTFSCYFYYHCFFLKSPGDMCMCVHVQTHIHKHTHLYTQYSIPRVFYYFSLPAFRFIYLEVYALICNQIYLLWLLLDKHIRRPWSITIIPSGDQCVWGLGI